MMEDDRVIHICERVITAFFLRSCTPNLRMNEDNVRACARCVEIAAQTFRRAADGVEYRYVPLITGSVAEFYVRPPLSCVGDVDVMTCAIATTSWQ